MKRGAEGIDQNRVLITHSIRNVKELVDVSYKFRAPTATRIPAGSGDEARREVPLGKIHTPGELSLRTMLTNRRDCAGHTGQHRVGNDSITHGETGHRITDFAQPPDVLVSNREWERCKRRHGRTVMQPDQVQVAATDAGVPHFHPRPLVTGQSRLKHITVTDAGQRSIENRLVDRADGFRQHISRDGIIELDCFHERTFTNGLRNGK